MMACASSRSRLLLPDSTSPNAIRCGSAVKSRKTGARSFSAIPIGIRRSPATGAGSAVTGSSGGSRRTCGARGPRQAASIRLTRSATPAARSLADTRPSTLGSAVRNCSLSAVRPRPGLPWGTFAAARRSIAESDGSPSRSSNWVPMRSRVAVRISIQRFAESTTWMPYPRPRAASTPIASSSGSYSWRSVIQPSTTRKTSPKRRPSGSGNGAARNAAIESRPRSAKIRSRSASRPISSATMRRHFSASSRPAQPPTCGRPARLDSAPPPKSSR